MLTQASWGTLRRGGSMAAQAGWVRDSPMLCEAIADLPRTTESFRAGRANGAGSPATRSMAVCSCFAVSWTPRAELS